MLLIYFQDDFKVFMPESNACFSEGTVANFRSRYGHTQASHHVDKSFNYCYSLFRFTMQAYLTALGMKLMNFTEPELGTIPAHLVGCANDSIKMESVLDSISQKIEGVRERK
jgi:hypothetical protein